MRAIWFILKLPLKILMAPVILSLTLFVWICVGIVYVSGLVLGLISMVVALLGVAVLITYSLQNGIILLVIAFLISPYALSVNINRIREKLASIGLTDFIKTKHRQGYTILLWSSVFVTLVAKKYRFMQFELDRVFDTR